MEVLKRLEELGRSPSLSSSDKQDIETMYSDVLDKKFVPTSCSDCYRDAVIEMVVYLKKHGKMKEKRIYKLKAGALVQLEFGSSEFYTSDNITDKVSEEYLRKNPQGIKYFAEYPKDWEERIKEKDFDKELLESVQEALKGGMTAQAVVKEFSTNRNISKIILAAHVNRALEILAEEE